MIEPFPIRAVSLFIFFICLTTGANCFGQSNADILKRNYELRIAAVKSTEFIEKCHLQFSQPYYEAGDTVHFMAYVVMGGKHQLTNLSDILQVNLLSGSRIIQAITLKLNNGSASGDFVLSDTLRDIHLKVQAYTPQMIGQHNNTFFEQEITHVMEKDREAEKAITDFFPENGRLIADINNLVAFKSSTFAGHTLESSGIIKDDRDSVVARFKTTHQGMGKFDFVPKSSRTYKAYITYNNRTLKNNKSIESLQLPSKSGILLNVNNDDIAEAKIRAICNPSYLAANKGRPYSILIHSGEQIFSIAFDLDTTLVEFAVLKRKLSTGITTITLFSGESNEVLGERKIFIQNFDKVSASIDSTTRIAKNQYRIKVSLKTRRGEAARGVYSISISPHIDRPQNYASQPSIFSTLLLKSDLGGYNYDTESYFGTNISDNAKNLDLVMLTSVFQRYSWKSILTNSSFYRRPSREGLTIKGSVTTDNGVIVPDAVVTLISKAKGVIAQTKAKAGKFFFNGLDFYGKESFLLQAVAKPGLRLVIGLDSSMMVLNVPSSRKNFVYNSDQSLITTGDTSISNTKVESSKMLKEVKIRAKKQSRLNIDKNYGVADQILKPADIRKSGRLTNGLIVLLRGVRFRNAGSVLLPVLSRNGQNGVPCKIVLNGVEMPFGFDLDSILPGDVIEVAVITNATEPNGLLAITTSLGWNTSDLHATSILPIVIEGFHKARVFKGTVNSKVITNPFSAVCWIPNVSTDDQGVIKFECLNLDEAGQYDLRIEGVDSNGTLTSETIKILQ